MLDHFLSVGGNEIVNSARAYGYASTADCPASWLRDPECSTIATAQGQADYDYETIQTAPWYDPDDPDTTSRFLGVYCVEMRGLPDSTRTAEVVEKAGPGARVGGYRHAGREVRVRAWLTGAGEDALEAGMTWLRNALEPDACGVHGGSCGSTDATFFVACPPEADSGEENEDYQARVASYRRFLHSVRCISGPFVVSERLSSDGVHVGRLVEFTLLAENPWVHGMPKEIELPPIVPSVVEDIAYNLAPYPSAELSSSTVVVSTNYSENPSVETNATGWSYGADNTNITGAMLAAGRVTGELAAVGSASYRVAFTASGAGSNGHFYANQEVALPTVGGKRFSVNIWAAIAVLSGSPVLDTIRVQVYWRATAGGTVLRTDEIGTIPVGGGAVSLANIKPPSGATVALVRATARVTSWPSGTVIRLYADALSVTNP